MDLTNGNIYNFATEQARTIGYLNYVNLAVCLVIAGIVLGLLSYVALRFRRRPQDLEPNQDEGNIKYEITWTVIPAVILTVLGILTGVVMHLVNPPVAPERKPDVIVNAHQWWWEYRYPKSGVVTANELYLPEGVDSMIEIDSADVIHSFWVPDFGQKMDAIPGHSNHVFYKPIKKGVFRGSCSEFCGADHSLMGIVVNVVSPDEFNSWIKNQLKTPVPPIDQAAQKGQTLFMSKTCMQCHNIAGTSAKGQVGPDLTHVAQRATIGSGLIANNRENLTAWITNPQKFKPGCHMPDMRLNKSEAQNLSAYLETLK